MSDLTDYRAPEAARVLKKYATVQDYASRIHDRYFPDYERWE